MEFKTKIIDGEKYYFINGKKVSKDVYFSMKDEEEERTLEKKGNYDFLLDINNIFSHFISEDSFGEEIFDEYEHINDILLELESLDDETAFHYLCGVLDAIHEESFNAGSIIGYKNGFTDCLRSITKILNKTLYCIEDGVDI